MKRILFCFIALVFIFACGQKKSETKKGQMDEVSVRFPIPIVESGQTTFYYADDLGYYKDENIHVTFNLGSKELNPVKMVAAKTDHFAILGGPETLLVARSKGTPLKAIAIIHRNSNFPCLLTLKGSGITQLSQLNGQKIGFFYGHISTDVLRYLLRKENIKYTEVDVGFDYNQLIAKQIAAQWAFTVTAGLDLPAKGVEVNVISPADYEVITHGYTLFCHEDLIKENPDLVLRFLRASLRGIRATVENPEAANKALLKRDPSIDEALSLKRLKMYNAVTSNTDKFPAGYMDYDMLKTTYDRLVDVGVIETSFDVKDAYTTEFLEKIYRRKF